MFCCAEQYVKPIKLILVSAKMVTPSVIMDHKYD